MAETSAQDVVNEAQSMGDSSSIDVSGNTLSATYSGEGDEKQQQQQQHYQQYQQEKEQPSANTDADADADVHEHIISSNASFPSTAAPQSTDTSANQLFPDRDSSLAPDPTLVNGIDSASFTGSEDAGYQNLVPTEGSVHSDPEPSHDPLGRGDRGSSAKKPASFKAVSVTKNFLAKSGASSVTMSKLSGTDRTQIGTQASASASQAPKPRLVAKTGKDTRPFNLGNGSSTGAGPDASTVWNRNRPVPPPPPKQFTDEELKQQYGIHMATRLQADEAGKESKWADIDDDEDDWAPDTVQWMDGTKSTLLPAENHSTPSKPELPHESIPSAEDATKPISQQPQPEGSSSSMGKTILRPGARVTSQTRPGLVLRNVPDKPTQHEKPTQHSSGRSPWAPLPPVDKSSPITFHPPPNATARPPPPARRDSLMQDEDTSVTSPAREIAADDFDRSWRDGSADRGGRELFNSQSGRYEPVKSMRRGSRHDGGGFRPPAVLQRPSSQQQHQAPAVDGSAPLQSRESHSWAARRDSSSYGMSNASNDRRPSMDPELHAPTFSKDESDAALDSLRATNQVPSPGAAPLHTYSAHGPDANRPSSSSESTQDPRILQQQLMRERIELNRRRKQEEEAKEEAARKERIRLKMEALGPPAQQSSDNQNSSPQLSRASETSPQSQAASLQESSQQQARATAVPPEEADLQAFNPAPENAPDSETMAPSHPQNASNNKSPAIEHSAKKSLSDSNLNSSISAEIQQLPGLGQPIPQDRQIPSWNRQPRALEYSSNWSNKPISSSASNVWGPPTSDRPLGNGAFENELNRVPTVQLSTGNSMTQTQIRASPNMPFKGAHPTPSPPHHIQPRQNKFSHHPPSTAASSSNKQTKPFMQQPIHPPNRSNYPSYGAEWQKPKDLSAAKKAWASFPAQLQMEEHELRERTNREWEAKMAEEERTGISQDIQPTFRETFKQTGASDGLGGTRRVLGVNKIVYDGSVPGVEQPAVNGSPQAPFVQRPITQQPVPAHLVNNGRASRFFGPSAGDRTAPLQMQPAFDEFDMFSGPPSPPPPDDSVDHPVNAGQTKHPLVKIRPKPTVKLPEPGKEEELPMNDQPMQAARPSSQPAPIQPPGTKPAATATYPSQMASSPVTMPPLTRSSPNGQNSFLSNQIDWQSRFHSLFGRAPTATSNEMSKAKGLQSAAPAPPVSSTKSQFEPSPPTAAKVSLPHGVKVAAAVSTVTGRSIETKPTEEELLDEREFGSSPTVRLYKGNHPREQEILPPCPAIHLSVPNTPIAYLEKANREFASTKHILSFDYVDEDLFVPSGVRIKVHLMGKPSSERILHKKVSGHAQAQARRPKTRITPKKPYSTGKGPGSRSSPRPDAQNGEQSSSTSTPIRKKTEDSKTTSTAPVTTELAAKASQTASSAPVSGPAQPVPEKTRPRSNFAKGSRSLRGKKVVASRT